VARTAATIEDLEAGNLPPVCAKTGEPADGFATMVFTSTPQWTWILLFFGILPFLIVRYFTTVRITGLVPMSDVALGRARAFTWTYRGFFVLSGLVIVIGFFMRDRPAILLEGLVILIVTLLVMLVGWPFFWPLGRVSDEWVFLHFVHERFADELDRRYADR
jgi:hypothetical protein